MNVSVEVRRDLAVVPLLEPLWHSLRQHQGALERVPPLQDTATSWAVERDVYCNALRHPDAFAAVATDESTNLVGYAFARVHSGPDEMWRTSDRVRVTTWFCRGRIRSQRGRRTAYGGPGRTPGSSP